MRSSTYTHTEFRAYKSLEVYGLFSAGWVLNVKYRASDDALFTGLTCEVNIVFPNCTSYDFVPY